MGDQSPIDYTHGRSRIYVRHIQYLELCVICKFVWREGRAWRVQEIMGLKEGWGRGIGKRDGEEG